MYIVIVGGEIMNIIKKRTRPLSYNIERDSKLRPRGNPLLNALRYAFNSSDDLDKRFTFELRNSMREIKRMKMYGRLNRKYR